jgi:hypothetical protein
MVPILSMNCSRRRGRRVGCLDCNRDFNVEIDLPKVTIWKGVSNAFSLLPDCTFSWPSGRLGNDDRTFNPFTGNGSRL